MKQVHNISLIVNRQRNSLRGGYLAHVSSRITLTVYNCKEQPFREEWLLLAVLFNPKFIN